MSWGGWGCSGGGSYDEVNINSKILIHDQFFKRFEKLCFETLACMYQLVYYFFLSNI